MKKYFILITIVFNLFIMNVKGVNYDTISIGPVTWNNYYYTKLNNATGHKSYSYMQMFIRNSDKKAVYCIEPGVLINFDETYPGYDYNQAIMANLSQSVFEKVSLIAYFGYGYQDNNYNHTDSLWWAVTQWMIWQEANNNHTLYFTLNQNYSGNEAPIERFTSEMAEINALIDDYYTNPDISIPTMVLGQTIELNDTNKVLHNYEVIQCRGCEARIENDKLILKATEVSNSLVRLERKFDKYNSDPIVYISNNSQNAMAAGNIKNKKMGINYFTTAGQVNLRKLDFDTKINTPQGEAVLNGAIYGVYNNNQKITEVETDNDGKAMISNLPVGSYYIQEIKSSNGYTLNTNKYYFNIDNNHLNININVYEKVIEKTFELTKVKANANTGFLEPEEGIVFEFYFQKTNELYKSETTDINGKLSVVLPYGSYIVHQANSDENVEKIEDFLITVDNSEDSIISKVIANAYTSAKVKVIKIDKETKEIIKVSGIKFKIKNIDTGDYVCQSISYPEVGQVCVFETNKDGFLITPYPLPYGNYQIEEIVQNIDGYLVNVEPKVFEISNNTIVYDDKLGYIIEILFENEKEIIEEHVIDNEYIPIIEEPMGNIIVDVPNTEKNNYYLVYLTLLLALFGEIYVKEKEC